MDDVRALIAKLTDETEIVISEGMSVYDVEPVTSRVCDDARSELVAQLDTALPVIVEVLPFASAASARAMLSVIRDMPIAKRIALPDEALIAIFEGAQRVEPPDGDYYVACAVFERDFARRVRAGELGDAEAFWRGWLAHPSPSAAFYELVKIVEDKAAFVREVVPFLEQQPYGVCHVLEAFPFLPDETVRALAAGPMPRRHEELVPILARYGEPAAALVPLCLEMLQNEPLAEDDSWNGRHVRWRRATKALGHLVAYVEPALLEARLAEMSTVHLLRDCADDIRKALAARARQ